MKVLVAGGTGFVGSHLLPELTKRGHSIHLLSRRSTSEPNVFAWDVPKAFLDHNALVGVDAVINLTGENLASGRWTSRRKQQFERSRIDSIRLLRRGFENQASPPKVWVNASAIGIYGDRGDEVCDENATPGSGFLAELCHQWESEVGGLSELGIPWTALRIGMVLGQGGGALAKLVPIFRWRLGARLGSGKQWISWIHVADLVRLVVDCLENAGPRGVVNAVAPNPVTNSEFTTALAAQLGRPTFLPVPAFALRCLLGEMAVVALASQRVAPAVLTSQGFGFLYNEIGAALAEILDGY